MILPLNLSPISNSSNYLHIQKNQNPTNSYSNKMKLSGYNNPMKSYVSFGWCTAHYQAMYDIDVKYSEKIKNRLKEIEELKQTMKQRYSSTDKAAIEAAKILAQYANMQCVIAEVPPAYAVMNGGTGRC